MVLVKTYTLEYQSLVKKCDISKGLNIKISGPSEKLCGISKCLHIRKSGPGERSVVLVKSNTLE